jgi:hypothetical protein
MYRTVHRYLDLAHPPGGLRRSPGGAQPARELSPAPRGTEGSALLTKDVRYNVCLRQSLSDARDIDEREALEEPVDAAAVDAVLTASRSLIAVATRSLGAAVPRACG